LSPAGPRLTPAQLDALAEVGEERRARAGETLFAIGDHDFPFLAVIDGQVAVVDAGREEIARFGPSEFVGETSLLTGQTAFLTAVALEPTHYVAVERERLRGLLFDDGSLSDLMLSTFTARRERLQAIHGLGVEIIGPQSSQATRRIVESIRANRIPFTWRDPDEDVDAAGVVAGLDKSQLPLVRLPGGAELNAPSVAQLSQALGVGRTLQRREEVDLVIVGGGPAGLAAAVYGASEGLETLVIEAHALGGQAGTSQRIENYLGFPGGITGAELTGRAAVQAFKFGARTATPYRGISLEPHERRLLLELDEGHTIVARTVVLATGAEYRRLPLENLSDYEGISVFYAAGPPEGQLCAGSRVIVVGGGNSAGQAAVWLSRNGSLVTLLHRRRDLDETMSDYLIQELARFGVQVRDQSEVVELRGANGHLNSVTLKSGERVPASFLFLFLGARPCSEWLDGTVATDDSGFIETGSAVGGAALLETSVPGVFAAGDVRSGSTKRCAAAVGEGAMAVQLVHAHLASGLD